MTERPPLPRGCKVCNATIDANYTICDNCSQKERVLHGYRFRGSVDAECVYGHRAIQSGGHILCPTCQQIGEGMIERPIDWELDVKIMKGG